MIENEYNFLLVCPFQQDLRRKLLPNYYCSWLNTHTFIALLTTNNSTLLKRLSSYLNNANKRRTQCCCFFLNLNSQISSVMFLSRVVDFVFFCVSYCNMFCLFSCVLVHSFVHLYICIKIVYSKQLSFLLYMPFYSCILFCKNTQYVQTINFCNLVINSV